jgi:hypothetical protein
MAIGIIQSMAQHLYTQQTLIMEVRLIMVTTILVMLQLELIVIIFILIRLIIHTVVTCQEVWLIIQIILVLPQEQIIIMKSIITTPLVQKVIIIRHRLTDIGMINGELITKEEQEMADQLQVMALNGQQQDLVEQQESVVVLEQMEQMDQLRLEQMVNQAVVEEL